MIFLNNNENNTVVLNLTCNSSLYINSGTTPYFLFCFSSDTTHQTKLFVSENIAPLSARSRYDSFVITPTGGTENLTGGTVDLNPAVFWTYTVFDQLSKFNLNPVNSVSMVGEGKVFLSGVTTNFEKTYYNGGTAQTQYFVYNSNY